jgi:hypothetical protein
MILILSVLLSLVILDLIMLPRTKKTVIQCELILASLNVITGDILYTFKETFNRFILAEKNTHMIAGKNTASSRAIPPPTLMKKIWKDPFLPYSFGTYKSGMQAGPPLTGKALWLAQQLWLLGRYPMLAVGLIFHYIFRCSKEVTNRLYEPWMWCEQIWTSTDVINEQTLRNHWMAEPHYQELARQKGRLIEEVTAFFAGGRHDRWMVMPGLYEAYMVGDRCQVLSPGEWHLPFVGTWQKTIQSNEYREYDVQDLKKISAGRCAWVSYFMPGDNSKKMQNYAKAIETYAKLAESDPKHTSPLMHQGTPIPKSVRVGNLCGFLQFRKEIAGESGGDKVVPSITPVQAQELLNDFFLLEGKHEPDRGVQASTQSSS